MRPQPHVGVLANNATTFFRCPTSQKVSQEKYRYTTSSELENSVLEINYVTKVTTVLNESTTSDRVSRFSLASLPRSLSSPPPLPPPRARGRSGYSVQMCVISKLTDSLCVSLALNLGSFVQSVLKVQTCVCEFASHTRTRIHTYTHI
jgi:hypothetical protein